MKKFLLTIVLVFAYGFSVYAYYEKNYPITVTQPDGTVVHCFTTGDEFYRWVHDENGFTLIRDPQTGIVVYARLENDELISSGYRVGSIDPVSIGLTPWQIISAEKRTQLRSDFLKPISEKPMREGFQPSRSGQNNGTLNNLVIYVRFSDEDEFPPKGEKYNDFFNKDEPGKSSMYAYFKAFSGERTFIPSTFYPISSGSAIISYQDIHPRSYYQPYDATTNPNGYHGGDNGNERTTREHQLCKRAVEAVESVIPEDLDLDFNGDGYVDNICFLVSGSPGAWASLLWPHRWALYTDYVSIHGIQVWDFNLLIETHLDGAGPSVLSHEMFHTLSAPDLYRYSDNTIDPVGSWDLMCANANPPQSATAWVKYKYGGWIDNIPEITESGVYTLHNIWNETNNAYKIKSPNSSTEFFVIEYRDKNVYWDSGLPGSGLLVSRINTLVDGNSQGPPDEVYVFRPGGYTTTTPGNLNAAHFSNNVGRTVFNNVSNPPCFLSDNTPGDIALLFNQSEIGGETILFEVDFSMINTALHVTPDNLNFPNIPVGITSEPQTITVSGTGLKYEVLYEKSGTNNELFTIEETDWNPATGGTLSVRFTPNTVKVYTSKITISSMGATPKTISLKGSGSSVAIDEQTAPNITIYPNPTTGELKIMNNEQLTMNNVEIFDVYGRKIFNFQLSTFNSIDISDLPVGLYFARIRTENGVITRKIIKKPVSTY